MKSAEERLQLNNKNKLLVKILGLFAVFIFVACTAYLHNRRLRRYEVTCMTTSTVSAGKVFGGDAPFIFIQGHLLNTCTETKNVRAILIKANQPSTNRPFHRFDRDFAIPVTLHPGESKQYFAEYPVSQNEENLNLGYRLELVLE